MTKKASARIAGDFVKSWDTEVTVGRTKHTFEDLLKRYGATGFTVSEEYSSQRVLVQFAIMTQDGEVTVALPVSYQEVLKRLRRMTEFQNAYSRRSLTTREAWQQEQAARVAWRHLLLWADAALSAVDAGLYSLQEAFFAHTMIETPGGGRLPAVDVVNAMRRLNSGNNQTQET